jgi:hypothetical protein
MIQIKRAIGHGYEISLNGRSSPGNVAHARDVVEMQEAVEHHFAGPGMNGVREHDGKRETCPLCRLMAIEQAAEAKKKKKAVKTR